MPDPSSGRPDDRTVEDEQIKLPKEPDQPPRPATEPPGSEGSSETPKTKADPATGDQPSTPDGQGGVGPAALRDTPKVG